MLPTINTFMAAHQLADVTIADAGMFSTGNKQAIEAAGLSFILGTRTPDVPYMIAEWRRQHAGEPIPDGLILTQPSGAICLFDNPTRKPSAMAVRSSWVTNRGETGRGSVMITPPVDERQRHPRFVGRRRWRGRQALAARTDRVEEPRCRRCVHGRVRRPDRAAGRDRECVAPGGEPFGGEVENVEPAEGSQC